MLGFLLITSSVELFCVYSQVQSLAVFGELCSAVLPGGTAMTQAAFSTHLLGVALSCPACVVCVSALSSTPRSQQWRAWLSV